MNTNMQRLGDTLAGRMNKTVAAHNKRQLIELGTIGGGLSLVTDSGMSIPKGQYMVNLDLTASSYETKTARACSDDNGHDHKLPEVFRAIKAGDRVLVAWAGNEAVVLAIVKSS